MNVIIKFQVYLDREIDCFGNYFSKKYLVKKQTVLVEKYYFKRRILLFELNFFSTIPTNIGILSHCLLNANQISLVSLYLVGLSFCFIFFILKKKTLNGIKGFEH